MVHKKIAMICFGDILSPRNGYVLRCWTLAKLLKERGNSVSIYQFCDYNGSAIKEDIKIISYKVRHEEVKKSRIEKLLSFNPTRELIFPFDSYNILKKHKSDFKLFDEIYIEGTLLIGPAIFAKQLHKTTVLDTHCLNKAVAMRMQEARPIPGLIRRLIWHTIESRLVKNIDEVIAISENDKKFIEDNYSVHGKRISVIPHVVNPADSKKYLKDSEELAVGLSKGFRHVACYVGDYSAIQNQESAKFVLETLAPATPDIHYMMLGNNKIGFVSQSNVTFTGFVDAFDPYLMAADFCIAPMSIGSGIKTKVLDYLKYDKIVIGTSVAFEGIDIGAKSHLSSMKDFVSTVKKVAQSI